MSPSQGGSKRANHSLSFVLGPQNLVTSKKNQILSSDISFEQISEQISVSTLASTPLPSVVYGITSIVHLTLMPLMGPYPGFLKEHLPWAPFQCKPLTPRGREAQAHLSFLESPTHSVCYNLSLTLFSKTLLSLSPGCT